MNQIKDWQNVCKDNKSRAEHILKNVKLTDCMFAVGQGSDTSQIRGHKLILAMASPVFERMFYGDICEKSNEIRIPDIKNSIFQIMLDYIYFENLELKSVDEAIELYAAANKYMLQNQMRECVNYLTKNCNGSNACKIYEFAVFYEEESLMARSRTVMISNTKEVLAAPSFLDASLTTLNVLFDRDYLEIDSELDLFDALNKYALELGYFNRENSDNISELNESTADHKNVELKAAESENKLLKDAVKKIRFLSLTPEEFEIPANSKLLSDSEALSILRNIINPGIENCPMPKGFTTSRCPGILIEFNETILYMRT